MVRPFIVPILSVLLLFPLVACAHGKRPETVDVRVVADGGREYATYRAYPRSAPGGRHFYLEAIRGERYSIIVTNRTGRRIGVVIAVDGRNIISGAKSELRARERMYIVGPGETQAYEGWRTGMERTNRFYFTDQADSYAERAFSDGSAMGTIAAVVFREKAAPVSRQQEQELGLTDSSRAAPKPSLESGKGEAKDRMKSLQPGTGFGEAAYSPARIVRFEPEERSAERIVFKYEWRAELVRKGVIRPEPENRLWPPEGDFAPYPPSYRG